jgi:hypothetical protein
VKWAATGVRSEVTALAGSIGSADQEWTLTVTRLGAGVGPDAKQGASPQRREHTCAAESCDVVND